MNQNINKTCFKIYVFNGIAGFNESKTLTTHISCGFKCKFHGRKCGIKICVHVNVKIQ